MTQSKGDNINRDSKAQVLLIKIHIFVVEKPIQESHLNQIIFIKMKSGYFNFFYLLIKYKYSGSRSFINWF